MITFEEWKATYGDSYVLSLSPEYIYDMYEDFLNDN